MRVDVGSFTKQAGTGNQDITIPVDLTTAGAGTWAINFFTTGSDQASGTWDAGCEVCLGFVANGGGTISEYSVAATSEDAVATSNTGRRMAAKCITLVGADGATTKAEAGFVSFPDATHFRINWSTNANDAIFNGIVINFMILSGLTGAKVVNWTTPTTAIDKAVTGVGFSPDLVLHASLGLYGVFGSTGNEWLNFGMMNKHGQQAANGFFSQTGVNPTRTDHVQQTDACSVQTDGWLGIGLEAHFKSMDTDGFTAHFSSVGGIAFQMISLCLDGVSSKIGAFVPPNVTSHVVDTRQGFVPKGVLFSNFGDAPLGAPTTQAIWSLSATDLTNHRSVLLADRHNSSPTQADSLWANDGHHAFWSLTGPTDRKFAVGSVGLDSVTITSAVMPVTVEVLYLLLGDAGTNTFPAKVA